MGCCDGQAAAEDSPEDVAEDMRNRYGSRVFYGECGDVGTGEEEGAEQAQDKDEARSVFAMMAWKQALHVLA